MNFGTIHFEETGEERIVTGLCARCASTDKLLSLEDVMIVSPRGMGHLGSWMIPENTACGINATGDDWWHRL